MKRKTQTTQLTKTQRSKNISIRMPTEDIEEIKKFLGPFGKFAPLVKKLLKDFMNEQKANAA